MSKRWFRLWGLLAICGLVACRAAATPTLAPSPTPAPTSTPVLEAPTATQVSEAPKEEEQRPTATAAAEPADATPPWRIPQVGEKDWTKGMPGAGLVVVEYSDFQ